MFKEELNKISSYGELGCGQSTIYAYKQGKDVVSVESDKKWLSFINTQLESINSDYTVSIIHNDIGSTGNWESQLIIQKDKASIVTLNVF